LANNSFSCESQQNEECSSSKIENKCHDLKQDRITERRPSSPKYCTMNSVIISPAPSRQSSIRLSHPRTRAETLNIPNTWMGLESVPSSQRVRKLSQPTYSDPKLNPSYSFYGEERAYDFPSKGHSSLYAEDDYRSAAGQFLDSTCPCSPRYSLDSGSSTEEKTPSETSQGATRAYNRFLLFVAATLLIVLVVTGITVVSKKMGKTTKIDIVEVIEILKSKQTEGPKKEELTTTTRTPKNFPNRNDAETFATTRRTILKNRNKVETSREEVEVICCKIVSIVSQDKVAQVYPTILGDYRRTKIVSERPIYAKLGAPIRYLSQPQSDTHVLGYSWGVSQTPKAKWGYIRSSKAGPCPTLAGKWKVFDRDTKRWIEDSTLQIVCKDP